jgi:hypothetical protein
MESAAESMAKVSVHAAGSAAVRPAAKAPTSLAGTVWGDPAKAEAWRAENAAALTAMERRIADEGVAGEEHRRFG